LVQDRFPCTRDHTLAHPVCPEQGQDSTEDTVPKTLHRRCRTEHDAPTVPDRQRDGAKRK
jgi:hypothetical protein